MNRRWPPTLSAWLALAAAGCHFPAPRPEYVEVERVLHNAAHRPPHTVHPDEPMAAALDPVPAPPELAGPQPVDAYIRRALAENRLVQAARYNVLALQHRIPQVTALDDPTVSNTIWPFPSNAPQYSLMGYMPYDLLVAQQFPWFGTLRLRGEAAAKDVEVALAELGAAQLDAVANVKRAYYDLYFNERAEAILVDNRKLVEDFIELARVRYAAGETSQQDVLRAEVILSDLDRELTSTRQALASARADLAQQLHVSPEADLRTLPEAPIADVPAQVERLYRLAAAARPELQGRLAAIARDQRAVELAKKRYFPNVTLGVGYSVMTKQNNPSPEADGRDNVGFFVGFNLPVYRGKLEAGVREAEARAIADAKLYEAERDRTYREVKDLLVQAKAQQDILGFFRTSILPRSEQALEVAASDYRTGNIDWLTLITAWREVLQIRLQIAQVEAELGKALASLERSVGTQLNQHPPVGAEGIVPHPAPPPPPTGPGPFQGAPAPPNDAGPGRETPSAPAGGEVRPKPAGAGRPAQGMDMDGPVRPGGSRNG